MRNTRPEKQSLTPMQKQAVLVCSVCALAAILTIAITMTLLKRGKTPAAPGEQPSSEVLVPGEEDISDHYQISETSAALLPETADAGESYQKETLFLGDSNTVRLYANGLISLQQFCAKEGIGTHAALNEGIVTFKKDSNTYTIAQAVAKMKPRRVVIMLGTNDTGMSVDEFIKNYTALVQAIQESYPYTDIIVNTVPPVPANHANYPHMDQTKIDDFNMALLSMCEQMGLKFLNSAEALKDANGYGREDYYQTGDIHLKPVGLKAMLSYLRTHAYQTDDRRPDTANIPTRAEYTPNPSSAVTAPSSSEAAGSSEEQGVLYQASYRVDKTGGTLSSGSDSGKTSLSYEVTSAAQSISVTAVPQDGYVFVKWSDGVTQKTRTDTNFKQNVDVTAVFAAASVHISSTGKAVLGDSYTFTAKLGGKHLTADSIRWYANGVEVPQAAGKTTVKVEIDPSMLNATFKVYAVASYNGCTVTSNVLNVTVSGVSSGSSSHSSGSSSGSSGSSGSTSGSSSSGSTSSSGASSGTTSGASSGATSTSGSSSHSSSDSSSHSSSSSESTASPAGSASASNGTASSSHSTSSSHADSGESSSASHSSSSSSASSGSSHAASESNASKEAANEQSASTDSAS
ncbi:SGNH/GDSL hydrolase family protein [Faecalibacterium prausnitzii]|uniref:SGNH/GDSL hydrolase family protein n=1 Tax=Faecalibacterium TaxID=216851 RepID=UPI0032F03CA7